jgi:hypothetical protein
MKALERVTARELIDDPACSDHELRSALRDLSWINRIFGSHAFVQSYLDRIVPVWRMRRTPSSPLVLLDVATGGADVPQAVVRWGARRRVPVRVIAVDRHPGAARFARESTCGSPAISVVQADARTLPFLDGRVDVCLCNLALHHLTPDEDVALLRRLHRLARFGFLAVDLRRSWAGYAAVWLLTRLSPSPLIRSDGPLSVRRAFSWDEYGRLVAAAAIPGLRLIQLPLFRVALAWTA